MSNTNWETPPALFARLDAEFQFTLDPCASTRNAKCKTFYTLKDNGLFLPWNRHHVFMNPPYGKTMGRWIKKAYEASLQGALVVCLIPASTNTKYFHQYCLKAEIRFIQDRVYFYQDGQEGGRSNFPTMIVIFYPGGNTPQQQICGSF